MDRDRVIKGLTLVREHYRRYYTELDNAVIDVLILLKEQQEQIDRLIKENASNAEMAEGLKELLKKQEPEEPIHVHEEYPEHEWELDKYGKPDDFAFDYGYHNGPSCKRCNYSFCIHCKPDGWNDKPCIIDYYECPGCKKMVSKNTAFCSNCGQAVKWDE